MATPQSDPTAPSPGPGDRTRSDGEAGRGDMLGGTGAGAGDRLGPDEGGERASASFPISSDDDEASLPGVPNQHDLDAEEPRTDADLNYHGMDRPA